MGAYLADLYDYDKGLARQFWNRANAGSARLYGKAAGLLGRGADLVGLKGIGQALAQQRAGALEDAEAYDTQAGAPRNLGEKITGFAGAVTPDLMAYAAGGEIAGVGKAVGFGANVLRGTLGALPITAALEADPTAEETSPAKAIGRLLGSPKIEALSQSAAGRVAVGATLDLAGNVIGEGIATGIRKWKGEPVHGSRITNELAPPPPVVPELEAATQGAVHSEAEKPLWQAATEQKPETVRLFHGTSANFDRFAAERGSDTGLGGRGYYFGSTEKHAGAYGPRIVSVDVPKSKILDLGSDEAGEIHRLSINGGGAPQDIIQARGYEGVSHPQTGETVLFDPNKYLPDVTSQIGDASTPVRYAAEHEGPGHTVIVHRSTQEPGKIQVTRLDASETPYGHTTFDSPAEAVEEVTRMGGNRVGFVNPTVAAHLASAGVGGTVGAQVGDTPEERQQNALLGAAAGLGVAAAGTAAARAFTKAKPAPIAAMADPAVQKVASMRSTASRGDPFATVREILKGLHSQQINKLAPLNEFSRAVLGTDELRHAAQNASGWIEAAGSRLRTDFKPVVEASKGIEDAVETLLIADRALELDRNGLSNKGVDLVAAQRTSQLLSADPRVKAAADLYRDYYRKLLQRRADAGLITPDDYNRMIARGAYYTPFVRDAEHGASNASRGSRGLMQKGSGVRKMSDEMATSKIESPLRQAMKDTYQLERDISRQRVNDLIVKGWATNPLIADDFVRQIPKGAKAPAGKVAETIRYQGQDMTFAVDQDFHKAWTSLAPDAQDIALDWMGKVKNVQRFGVTMAIPFTVRNATRDLVFTAVQQPFTRSHLAAGAIGAVAGAASSEDHPVEGAVMGFSSGVVGLHALKVAKAFSEVVGKSKLYEEYLQAGGGGFGFWPRTQKDLDKVYAKLRDGTTAGDVISPKGWLEGLEYINHAIESAPRLAEARRVAEAGGTITEAAAAGRNISVDFSLGGSSLTSTIGDRATPFYNAQKQALAKTLTVLKSPKAWAMGGVLITAPSVALWNLNKDDPEYWKQPLWVRNTCWLVKKPDGEGFYKIVKPHEFGYLFGSLPERLLDYAYQNGKLGETKEKVPYHLGAGLAQLAGAVGAGPMPGAVKPVLEVATNYDLFRGRPVVSDALSALPTEMQYDDRTSTLGRGVSAVTQKTPFVPDISPVQADHLLRGYFGTAGQGINDAITDAARGLGVDDRGPVAMDKDRGVLGGFTTDPLATPQPALDVLESDRNIAKLQRVSEHLLQTGQYDKLGPWYEQHAAEMGAGQLTQTVAEQLRTLAGVELQIERSKGMPPEQKQQQIKQIRDAQYQLAKLTVQ